MESDRLEVFHRALIQHGPYNKRIYLMKIGDAHPEFLITKMISLCKENGYTKIFAKVPLEYRGAFTRAGFQIEAKIPQYYNGYQTALFCGYFLDPERKKIARKKLDDVLALAQAKAVEGSFLKPLNEGAELRVCKPEDCQEMARIYRKVFPSYPFPIHSPEYLKQTMESHIMYFGIEHYGKLVSISSAEMECGCECVEMTDFATLPAHRGHGYAAHLLGAMEEVMIEKQIRTSYTIARACSPGMNITFSKSGYSYAGRLKNNTQISGQIESMNVWYKHFDIEYEGMNFDD